MNVWSGNKILLLALLAGPPNSPAADSPAAILNLPPRAPTAVTGTQFIGRIAGLDLPSRDQQIASQILGGNVPDFLRRLCPVHVTNTVSGKTNWATFFVTSDYLAVGSDGDYFLAPMAAQTA